MCAFRVIWRPEGDSEGLARAWDYIVSQRHLCDQVVAQSPSLQMFVSCISGIFNTGRPMLEQANPVYPAVSYWAVFDGASTVNIDLISSFSEQLCAACPSAMVRTIKSLRIRKYDHTQSDSGTLFTVLKDHCSWFVCQKIVRSLVACGAAAVPSREPPNAKVVMMPHSKYLQQLPESVVSLNVAGLRLEFEVFRENFDN